MTLEVSNMSNKNRCAPTKLITLWYYCCMDSIMAILRGIVGSLSANRNSEIIMQNRYLRVYSSNYTKRKVYRAVYI